MRRRPSKRSRGGAASRSVMIFSSSGSILRGSGTHDLCVTEYRLDTSEGFGQYRERVPGAPRMRAQSGSSSGSDQAAISSGLRHKLARRATGGSLRDGSTSRSGSRPRSDSDTWCWRRVSHHHSPIQNRTPRPSRIQRRSDMGSCATWPPCAWPRRRRPPPAVIRPVRSWSRR